MLRTLYVGKEGEQRIWVCVAADLLRRRGCGRCRGGVLLRLRRRRGCAGCRVGLLYLVVLGLGSGTGGLSGLGRRRSCRILRSRGGGALRLSGRWILCRRGGTGLCGALCQYRQGQGEHNERPQDDSKQLLEIHSILLLLRWSDPMVWPPPQLNLVI